MLVKEREYVKAYTASQSNLFFFSFPPVFIMAGKTAVWGDMEANVQITIVHLALIFKYC